MKINIEYAGDKYAIDITEESYNLIKYGTVADENSKNFGQQTEKVLGYFSNVSSAVRRIIKSSLANQGGEISLKEYVERIEKATEELTKSVNEQS